MLWPATVSGLPEGRWVMAAAVDQGQSRDMLAGGDALALWAERTGIRRAAASGRGGVQFAFYGRVSTEDWQDPVTSRARQLQQAVMLTAGRGVIVAEFFDMGQSLSLIHI